LITDLLGIEDDLYGLLVTRAPVETCSYLGLATEPPV
jgi:hypothetical protein